MSRCFFRPLSHVLAAAACVSGAQAGIVVSSYTMQDGANLHGAYFDNLYNGTRSATGLLSGGTGDLTDGVRSVSVVAGYGAWAPYVMWDGQSPVITFDLGDVHTLSSVTAYFKYYPQAAVYMPASVDLRFSSDGVNFGASLGRALSDAERNVAGGNNADGVFQLLTSPGSGRYVQMTLQNGPENRWLALAEVELDGTLGTAAGTSSVPEPTSLALVGAGLALLAGVRRRAPSTSPRY